MRQLRDLQSDILQARPVNPQQIKSELDLVKEIFELLQKIFDLQDNECPPEVKRRESSLNGSHFVFVIIIIIFFSNYFCFLFYSHDIPIIIIYLFLLLVCMSTTLVSFFFSFFFFLFFYFPSVTSAKGLIQNVSQH